MSIIALKMFFLCKFIADNKKKKLLMTKQEIDLSESIEELIKVFNSENISILL